MDLSEKVSFLLMQIELQHELCEVNIAKRVSNVQKRAFERQRGSISFQMESTG